MENIQTIYYTIKKAATDEEVFNLYVANYRMTAILITWEEPLLYIFETTKFHYKSVILAIYILIEMFQLSMYCLSIQFLNVFCPWNYM